MNKEKEYLDIEVIPIDYKNSISDKGNKLLPRCTNCPVAQAIKRMYKVEAMVSPSEVSIYKTVDLGVGSSRIEWQGVYKGTKRLQDFIYAVDKGKAPKRKRKFKLVKINKINK